MHPVPHLVCATPRTGSSLLSFGLDSLGIQTSQDFFSRNAMHNWLIRFNLAAPDSTATDPRGNDAAAFAGRVNEEMRRVGVAGQKILYYQFQAAVAGGLLTDIRDIFAGDRDRVRVIHLSRADKVSQAISLEIANATLRYYRMRNEGARVSRGYEGRPTQEPTYCYERLAHVVGELREHDAAWTTLIDSWGLPVLSVRYEELCRDYTGTVRRAASFLGADKIERVPPPILQRQAGRINQQWKAQFEADLRSTNTPTRARARTKPAVAE